MADETTSDWKRKKEIVAELTSNKAECDAAVTAKQHEHKKVLKEVHKLENKTSGKVRYLRLSRYSSIITLCFLRHEEVSTTF